MSNRTLFLLSKGVSHTGTRLFTFALSWYILTQTGSGLSFSISLLVNYLPQIILSPLAGRLSDRIQHPNWVLVLCDLASAAVCCLPLVYLRLSSVYTTIFMLSAISAVFDNVIDTHLPHLESVDDPESLKKLTSFAQFITSGVNIAAPSLGGLLLQMCPVQIFAAINIISFLLSAFGEIWLRYRPCQVESAGHAGTPQRDGRAVLSYMFGSKKLRTFFLADSLGNFCFSGGVNVALPLIVTSTLGISSQGYGLISSSTALGSVLCALWRTKFPCESRFQYPFLQLELIGGCMLLLALTACFPGHAVLSVAVLCALMFAVGWMSLDINIRTKTTLQIFVEPAYLGKVLGVSTSISFVLIPLSLVITGGVSELYPAFVLPAANGALLIAALAFLRAVE